MSEAQIVFFMFFVGLPIFVMLIISAVIGFSNSETGGGRTLPISAISSENDRLVIDITSAVWGRAIPGTRNDGITLVGVSPPEFNGLYTSYDVINPNKISVAKPANITSTSTYVSGGMVADLGGRTVEEYKEYQGKWKIAFWSLLGVVIFSIVGLVIFFAVKNYNHNRVDNSVDEPGSQPIRSTSRHTYDTITPDEDFSPSAPPYAYGF